MDTQQAQHMQEAEYWAQAADKCRVPHIAAKYTATATKRDIRQFQRLCAEAAAVTDICDECGAEICDCIPPAAMAALLERHRRRPARTQ